VLVRITRLQAGAISRPDSLPLLQTRIRTFRHERAGLPSWLICELLTFMEFLQCDEWRVLCYQNECVLGALSSVLCSPSRAIVATFFHLYARPRQMYKRVNKKLVEDEDENGEAVLLCVVQTGSLCSRHL
jgi:hypothetical protein